MNSERHILLGAATPNQWERWIHGDHSVLDELPLPHDILRSTSCLFCIAYLGKCVDCAKFSKVYPTNLSQEPGLGWCVEQYDSDNLRETKMTKYLAGKLRLKAAGILACDIIDEG